MSISQEPLDQTAPKSQELLKISFAITHVNLKQIGYREGLNSMSNSMSLRIVTPRPFSVLSETEVSQYGVFQKSGIKKIIKNIMAGQWQWYHKCDKSVI